MRNIGDLQPPGAVQAAIGAGSAPLGATAAVAEAEYAPAWSNVLSLLESNHRPPGRMRRRWEAENCSVPPCWGHSGRAVVCSLQ